MTPEELKGKTCRRFLIEGRLAEDVLSFETMASFVFDGAEKARTIPVSAVKEILPEPVKVGDRVRLASGTAVTVLNIVDDGHPVALIKYDDGLYDGRPLSELTLVEPGE